MSRFILIRLLQLPLILLVIYTVTFALAWLLPGNPLEAEEGRRPPQEVMDAMLAQYQLDSASDFYVTYLSKASGIGWLLGTHDRPFDLGPSLRHENWSVNDILGAGLPVSMSLGLIAMLLACAIGITAGVLGGRKPGGALDASTTVISLIGVSVPAFVTGTVLLVVFCVWLGWLPIGRWGGVASVILPALTLSLPFAAYIARLTRASVIEQLQSDHVRTARAKGLDERRVMLRHVLPNAMLPVLSYLGPATAMAMTGSFVVEKVFAVPGVGTHFVDAVLGKDLTLIMGVVLSYATILVVLNLAVDVLYRWVDPRITT